jgi:DNA mismatch repair protein MSH6
VCSVDEEYDEVCARLKYAMQECDEYLKQLKVQFGDSSIKWVHKNKERFQFELSLKTVNSNRISSDFQVMSSTKTAKRFWSTQSKKLSQIVVEAEQQKEDMERDAARRIFARFAEQYPLWIGAVDLIGELDCLLSLALVSAHHAGCVRPEFISHEANGGKSMLELRNSSHPQLYEKAVINGLSVETPEFGAVSSSLLLLLSDGVLLDCDVFFIH